MVDLAYNTTELGPVEQTPDEQLADISSDLSVALLQDVAAAAYPFAVRFSDNAPAGSVNVELQMCTVEYLRDRLHHFGWDQSNIGQVPCVINRRDNVRIACSTDGGAFVGIKGVKPPTLRTKGKGTLRLAGIGGCFTPPLPGLENFAQGDDGLQKLDNLDFYYYLLRIDKKEGQVFSEFSQPIFDREGVARGWSKRIILPPVSAIPETSVTIKPAPTPEISVVRKAS